MKKLTIKSGLLYMDYAPCLWKLTKSLVWEYDGRTYVAPSGFVLDFYSIPRFLRWTWQQNEGTDNEPSAIHDYLVRHRKILGLSLLQCHSQFRSAMDAEGFKWWRRDIKYLSVLGFNWICATPGDGTPPKEVLEAMKDHGEPNLWKTTLPSSWKHNIY